MAVRRRLVAFGLAALAGAGGYRVIAPGGPSLPATTVVEVVGTPRAADVERAAEIIEARVRAAGERDARVTVGGGRLEIASASELTAGFIYEIAQVGDVAIRSIESFLGTDARAVTHCERGAIPNTPGQVPQGCYSLGAAVVSGAATQTVFAQRDESLGRWVVQWFLDTEAFERVRDNLMARQVALVVNGSVIDAPVVDDRLFTIDRAFVTEDRARGLAAVVAVGRELPVALRPMLIPTTTRAPTSATTIAAGAPRVNVDHWHAALGINVCGRWLPPAPENEYRADAPAVLAGVHSHGEGLVHVHPYAPDEAGDAAVLGRFFADGGWSVSADRLQLWDGAVHSAGDRCPGGEVAVLRWWVDGVLQRGSPAEHRVRDGQAIVIAFGPPDVRAERFATFPSRKYLR